MIILHVVEPFAAGIAVFVKSLTETMPDDTHIIVHGERKQEIAASEVKKLFPKKNVRFIKWHSAQRSINPFKDFMAFQELLKIIKRLKKRSLLDAVHLHSSKSGLLGRVACRMAGVENVIYTPNGAPFLLGGNSIKNFFYRQLEKIGNNWGGEVICCSASELEQYEKIGIKGSFINNGIPLPQTTTTKSPIGKKKFRIITSGRIVTQKNPALFNRIAAYFQEFDQFEFIWAGDGENRSDLFSSNIKVTGWLTTEQIKKEVQQADIYISTSQYEGLSFAVLEALSLQKPVLLSECVGNKDIIKRGLNGAYFKNASEAIIKIMHYSNNQDMLPIMGAYSKQICASEFNSFQNFAFYRQRYQRKKLSAL